MIINHNNQTDANNINCINYVSTNHHPQPRSRNCYNPDRTAGRPPQQAKRFTPTTRRLPPEPVALEGRRLAPTFLSRLNYIPKKAFPGR